MSDLAHREAHIEPLADNGGSALRQLMWMRLRGWWRAQLSGLRRPKRLLLMIGGLTLMALWIVFASGANRNSAFLDGDSSELALGGFLMFFPMLSLYTAVRQGLLAFTPAEVHLLFPGPVSSRALLASHLITNALKSLSGACFFALFMRPASVPWIWAVLAYSLFLFFVVSLQTAVDVNCIHLGDAARKRRARRVVVGILLALGLILLAARLLTPDRGWELATWAVLPARPFVALIRAEGLGGPGLMPLLTNLVLVSLVTSLLVMRVLRFEGNVRDASLAASEKLQAKLAKLRSGKILQDDAKERTDGTVLRMLPRWGGAGVHAWRQLSVLKRSRRSFTALTVITIFAGLVAASAGKGDPVGIASAIIAVLSFAGPMYVQCDFRSDYESLAWMRSFPTPPGMLALGQLLASALVLFVAQLLPLLVLFIVGPNEVRQVAVILLLGLPVLNLLQLSVWNGAYLISPMRMASQSGAPSLAQVLRIYMSMLGTFAVLAVSLAFAGCVGWLAWLFCTELVGMQVGVIVRLTTSVAALGALTLVTALCIWCVGRLFLRVDPSSDLGD